MIENSRKVTSGDITTGEVTSSDMTSGGLTTQVLSTGSLTTSILIIVGGKLAKLLLKHEGTGHGNNDQSDEGTGNRDRNAKIASAVVITAGLISTGVIILVVWMRFD